MRISPHERMTFQDSLRDTRIYGRTIAILIPTLVECAVPGCGFDELHDSAADPSCASCNGLGRTVSSWAIAEIFANVRNVDQSLVNFQQAPPGMKVGETFITISLRDVEMLRKVSHDKDSYLSVDGNAFRPRSIEVAGIGHTEEYVIPLAAFSPIFRASGY